MTEHACIQTPLGLLRIECSNEFISGISFVDAGEPSESITNPALLAAVVEIQGYFAGKRTEFTFLHRQPGTAFQQEVWQQLMLIPFGQTISYKELALRLGDDKKIRAAAAGNGKNNLAIVVPCHRVIGSNGQLVGYAGGLERKQWLLRHEANCSGKHVQSALF